MTAPNEKAARQGGLDQHHRQQFQHANFTRTRSHDARDVLRDAILAAAESYAKARLRDEFSAFVDELENGK